MPSKGLKRFPATDSIQCYLGKRRLDKAIEVYKRVYPGASNDTFVVSWSPFYLDPSLPKQGVPVGQRMAERFGPDRVEFMQNRLRMMGQPDGINFTFSGKIGNTRDAHRLIQLGKTKGLETQNRVVTELFRGYFEESGDITSHELLTSAGEKAGLDPAEIKKWLAEGKGGPEVDREVDLAYRAGIQGVPNFTINDKFTVDGAQDVQVFLEEFVKAKEAA